MRLPLGRFFRIALGRTISACVTCRAMRKKMRNRLASKPMNDAQRAETLSVSDPATGAWVLVAGLPN